MSRAAPRAAWRRALPRGLGARIVAAFLLVAVLSALTTAAVTYRQARAAILDRAQDSAVTDLRARVEALAPDLPAAPDEADLRALAAQLDQGAGAPRWRSAVTHHDGAPVTGDGAPPVLPEELRERAPTATTALTQRFRHGEEMWLALALPVASPSADGERPTGVVVHASFSLADQEADIATLVPAARAGAVPAVLLAAVAALFAARRVLRPVRRLRTAAERMAGGDLDTRIEATGDDELADLGRTFDTMAGALRSETRTLRAMEAKASRFAADVSHELRTPLAAMTAVTEVLDEDATSDALDPETAEAVSLVADETRKLARMVEDLMEISRFDAGAAQLDLDTCDIGGLVVRTLAARHWHHLVRVDVDDATTARLDARRFDVVLANLVGNALRHGGPHPAVEVRARTDADRLTVTVTDDGPGIAPETLPHVFDRFAKGDAARPRSEGSGLGLSIAVENAHLHGGTLTAANRPGGGAAFTLTLPRTPAPGAPPERPPR
ncbi:sensor histidine kinase [Streptomyces sedi]|uniref:histidine kinase n=1 Tax=Streptomyces sedi TaxID=555059 RepID=A0A5C4UYV6_9ACTN|nr:HAMP domain-containing sensor histidine kinase [Streptomyces sedi]TNM28772.1 HAMP domain-containing histidine kinase [Streptomyces sedi]